MKRLVATVEYDGTQYSGWQRQPFFHATIQETLETALSQVANEPIETTCAGRTDAGVHAPRQIIHFDTEALRDNRAWLFGVNRYLPDDIRLLWIAETEPDFDARRSAFRRHYRYLIKDDGQKSALWQKRFYTHRKALDVTKIYEASRCLIGEHDFSAFRASECQAKSPFRSIESIEFEYQNRCLAIDIRGNAFLHHMIRNIVGSLLEIGDGRKKSAWLGEVLASRDRRNAGSTAPACGLYFYGADYPDRFIQPPPAVDYFSFL